MGTQRRSASEHSGGQRRTLQAGTQTSGECCQLVGAGISRGFDEAVLGSDIAERGLKEGTGSF